MRHYVRIASCCIIISAIVYLIEYLSFFQISYRPTIQKLFKFVEKKFSAGKKHFSLDYLENATDYWRCARKTPCIYSAFWDHRFSPPFVRIIGVTSAKAKSSSWKCILTYNETASEETSVTLEKMPDNHQKIKTAAFFICIATTKPLVVELVVGRSRISPTAVRSMEFEEEEHRKKKLAVCVRPLFGNFFNSNSAIAEFIAYYQILGANHFTFYDYEAGSLIKRLFREMLKDGISLDMLPWKLPEVVREAWSLAQHSSIADCIYRNSRDYEFVAVVDIDEYIMPKKDSTLQELIESVTKPNLNFSTYLFRQSFFCMESKNDPTSIDLPFPLITQTKTQRERTIYPKGRRSKYIVRPDAIITPGIHFTWRELNSWRTLTIHPKIAMLHHYRASVCKPNRNKPPLTSTTALRYKKRLLESAPLKAWKKLNGYTK